MKTSVWLIIIAIKLNSTLICGINFHFESPNYAPDYNLIQEDIEKYRAQIVAFLHQLNSPEDLYEPLPIPSRMRPYAPAPAVFDLIRKKRNADLLEIIVAKKIPLTVLTVNGRSIFHELVAIGKSKVMSLVLDLYKKYNLNCAELIEAQNNQLWTPLMLAAATGHTACVKLLLDQGARVYCLNKEYESALHLSLQKYHMRKKSKINKIVNMLCNAGAEMAAQNGNKRTARDIACLNNFLEAADIIDRHTYLSHCKELRTKVAQQTYFALLPEDIVLSALIKANYILPCPEKIVAEQTLALIT